MFATYIDSTICSGHRKLTHDRKLTGYGLRFCAMTFTTCINHSYLTSSSHWVLKNKNHNERQAEGNEFATLMTGFVLP